MTKTRALIALSAIMASSPVFGAAGASDKALYQDSIKATKDTIANETLDLFYHDALDYYRDQRYDEALQLLDKITSINPHYKDASSLRDTIKKKEKNVQSAKTLDTVRDWMRKGDQALRNDQKALAISHWKQALAVNPDYAPAKKKIQDVNQALAKKEFEEGYIHYHRAEHEEALESWSNAVALDPTYKQKGLLLLMSKIELQVKKDQVTRLAAQGFEQFHQGNLADSLRSYEDLLALEPRHEEARRMAAKIKIQLSQISLKEAQNALSNQAYPEAVQLADKTIAYGYETTRAQAIKTQAERAIALAKEPKPKPKPKPKTEKKPVEASSETVAASSEPSEPVAPAKAIDPEKAMIHYRQGMAAIRKKDFHLAIDELDIAYQLDPSNERIYMARERAKQEWNAANRSRSEP